MTLEEMTADLEQRLKFKKGSIHVVMRKAVEKGMKHDQLNRLLTYIILNRHRVEPSGS